MIKYSARFLPTFVVEYYNHAPKDKFGHRIPATYEEWLATQGAEILYLPNSTQSDPRGKFNYVTFENPEDELVFRLRWAYKDIPDDIIL
jgi:hypothetical protein